MNTFLPNADADVMTEELDLVINENNILQNKKKQKTIMTQT